MLYVMVWFGHLTWRPTPPVEWLSMKPNQPRTPPINHSSKICFNNEIFILIQFELFKFNFNYFTVMLTLLSREENKMGCDATEATHPHKAPQLLMICFVNSSAPLKSSLILDLFNRWAWFDEAVDCGVACNVRWV